MKRFTENVLAIVFGIFISGLGVLIHNYRIGWFPAGLIVALLGTYSASRIIGARYGRRGARFWFLVGWTAIALRGASFGNGDELLIMANGPGNAFLGLGFLLVVLSIGTRL